MRITKWADMAGLTIDKVNGDDNTDDADEYIQECIFIHFTNGDSAIIKGFGDNYGDVDIRLVNQIDK